MICAIDPGSTQSAIVGWDGHTIHFKEKIDNAEVLNRIASIDAPFAIEMITGYGMQVGAEVFETCRWEGKYEIECQRLGKTCTRIRRRDVKSHVCENPTAKDSAVREALIDRIGPVGNKKDPGPTFGVAGDMWAALAVAVYAWDMEAAQ